MNDDPLPHLQDVLLRRELNAGEEQTLALWLAQHPEALAGWPEDVALSRALRRLPDVPVPSNFTSQVLDEIRRDHAISVRKRESHPSPWPRLRPRAWISAASTVAVIAVALGGWEWNVRRQQAEFSHDITQLRALADVPQEVLEDFDAIQRFGQSSPAVDFELLAALQ